MMRKGKITASFVAILRAREEFVNRGMSENALDFCLSLWLFRPFVQLSYSGGSSAKHAS